MTEFELSFLCFLPLAILLPCALGFVLYRRIARRERAIPITIASMAALAFVIGAAWWTAIHPAIWPNPPPAQPNPNAPPLWGLAILAGVSGVIALALGTVVLLATFAVWERARPGSFALLLARLKSEERSAPDSPPNPES